MDATPPPLRFAVAGLEHAHAYGITLSLTAGGAELAGFHTANEAAAVGFAEIFGQPTRFTSLEALIDDDSVDLVVPVGVPAERGAVAVAAMQAGKDVLADKPAVTDETQLAEVRAAQAETGRIFSVHFSERIDSRATMRASRLVADGAIGRLVQVVGFGPHRLAGETRPPWFFEPERAGGILNDLGSHQIDQFLHFTGLEDGALSEDGAPHPVEIVASMVANHAHPDHPGLEDYGEVVLRTPTTSGLARVDWYTPDGLGTWGDVRLFLLGTEGSIEVRKNCDLGGRDGGDHLFLVDRHETRHIDCRRDHLTFVEALLHDLRTRESTHFPEGHCLAVCDLALRAQAQAVRRGHLTGP